MNQTSKYIIVALSFLGLLSSYANAAEEMTSNEGIYREFSSTYYISDKGEVYYVSEPDFTEDVRPFFMKDDVPLEKSEVIKKFKTAGIDFPPSDKSAFTAVVDHLITFAKFAKFIKISDAKFKLYICSKSDDGKLFWNEDKYLIEENGSFESERGFRRFNLDSDANLTDNKVYKKIIEKYKKAVDSKGDVKNFNECIVSAGVPGA